MRAKYITARTPDEAKTVACEYMQVSESDLHIEIISSEAEGTANSTCTILVIQASAQEIADMDAFHKLYYEPDGVYLEIYPKKGRGAPFDNDTLIDYLKRKNVTGLTMPAVQKLVEQGSGRTRIGPVQNEFIFGEDVTVVVEGDESEAFVRLLAPEPGGPMLSVDDVKKKLNEAGVVYGIDEKAIETWLAAKIYNEHYLVAKATPPEDAEDGKLIFHFSTEERTGRPQEVGGGRVDYHLLDLYVPVTEGQLLVTKVPPTEGKPGMTVKGNVIKQRQGKEASMPRGKNITLNDDRTEMRSNYSGMVEFVNNTINVSNVYTIKGDCDMSTGNIDFEGSVSISGSVRGGHIVKATDGIFVGGSVEAATLIAGGNVEVKGGMLGADKGVIEARGAVNIMFIERGRITADGPIKLDVSIHSTLETGSTIHALGKRGAIIGGSASAADDIVASYIGALSGTRTHVEVGFLPRKRARVEELEKDQERIRGDQIKLAQLDAYLEKTKGTMDQATWDKLYISGVENKKRNEETAAANDIEIKQLKHEMENATKNKVHVLETAFGGSQITIGACAYKVTTDLNFATFKHSDGEIVCVSCEKSKADFK